MELQEALSNLEELEESFRTIRMNFIHIEANKKRIKQLEDKNKELSKDVCELNKFKKYFNLLASASKVEICGQCDGNGGFTWDLGEQGGAGEECSACEGTGIVEKNISPKQ